jgi:response regulator RpfG family c-di-GMP phosphodiesterase
MSYVSVRTTTLRAEAELLFDVYVEYKGEYLRFRSAAGRFELDVLERFKAKKVKKVFIRAEEEGQYLRFLDEGLNQLQTGSLAVGDRAEFAQNTLLREAENIGKTLESEEAYRASESRIQKVVEFMLKEPTALSGMLSAAGLAVDDSAHGSSVSSMCLAVGAARGAGTDELTDLAVAALLHDTSLSSLGFNLKTDAATLAKEQRASFRRHPAIAIEQAAGKKFITPRVLRLIEDHEEYGEGLGFPNKKRYAKLGEDSQIFNLCDGFDHFCVLNGKTAAEAFEFFIEKRGEHFDFGLIEILEKQIKAR